jgi:hypothetical protein
MFTKIKSERDRVRACMITKILRDNVMFVCVCERERERQGVLCVSEIRVCP